MKLLMLDNYDSFTYNLVQLVRENSAYDISVIRNDELSLDEVADYDKIILSPGPGLPIEAGCLCPLISRYYTSKPILGVCLGMQAIGETLGASLINIAEPLHGIATPIRHHSKRLLQGIPEVFEVGRYHSWAIDADTIPSDLEITASDYDDIVMAIEHKQYPVFGVQFHPESILTAYGQIIISNFLML